MVFGGAPQRAAGSRLTQRSRSLNRHILKVPTWTGRGVLPALISLYQLLREIPTRSQGLRVNSLGGAPAWGCGLVERSLTSRASLQSAGPFEVDRPGRDG